MTVNLIYGVVLRLVYLVLTCLVLLVVVVVSPSAWAIGDDKSVKLTSNQVSKLSDNDLWFKTTNVTNQPTFRQLKDLYQRGQPVSTTLGGSGAFVAKFTVSNQQNKSDIWFVNIHLNYLDVGTAYWHSANGDVRQLEAFGQLNSEGPKMAHSQSFSLPLAAFEQGTLWIYVQAKMMATAADITIYDKSTFYHKQILINSLTSISYTVMMALGLIAFFIFIRTRYLVTLACAGYIGLHGIGWFAASGGLGHLFLQLNFNPVYLGMMLFPLAIASAAQFTRLLFHCDDAHPKLTSTFNWLTACCCIVAVIMPFLPFPMTFLLAHIIAMFWVPLCVTTGVIMLAKKDFRAKYYLTGNIVYSLALTVYVISHIYKIEWQISSELIVLLALTIDCICILLSLSEWLQIQQKEFYRSYNASRVDPLTNIGNRFAQNEMLASMSGPYCITFIDLDNFKWVNDNLGHDVGDKFLVAVATKLKNKMVNIGSVFRCGGDEFILVVKLKSEKKSAAQIRQLASIITSVEKSLFNDGWQQAGLSYGTATSFETLNQSECLSLADKRMYSYKQRHKSNAEESAKNLLDTMPLR